MNFKKSTPGGVTRDTQKDVRDFGFLELPIIYFLCVSLNGF